MTVIVRYAFRERLMHALSGLSYVYLLLTGLAFWTPALYWIAVVLGGGYLSRLLHPWVGLVFSGAVLWMFVTWRSDMRITPEDRAWRRAMRHYIRNEDGQVPRPALQLRAEATVLADGARRRRAPALGHRAVVRRIHPVGAPRLRYVGRAGARRRGAGDDRRVHHPSLHGPRGRARRSSRLSFTATSPRTGPGTITRCGGADSFRGSRRNGRFEAGKYRMTIRTRRHRPGHDRARE